MAGPPFKWMWLTNERIDIDESAGETTVTIDWNTKSKNEPKPTDYVEEAIRDVCGDCIMYVGGGYTIRGKAVKGQSNTVGVGIPDVEDSGTVTFTVDGTKGNIRYYMGPVYTAEQWTEVFYRIYSEETEPEPAKPQIKAATMPDVQALTPRQFKFAVENVGGPGVISIQASGRIIDNIDIEEEFGPGETKTFTGDFELDLDMSGTSINVEAFSDSNRDSISLSSARILPNLKLRLISLLERLCTGEELEFGVEVTNSGGVGEVTTTLEGIGFEDIDITEKIGDGESKVYNTKASIGTRDKITADINVSAGDSEISKVASISRQLSNPSIEEVEKPEYLRPGLELVTEFKGTVERCNQQAKMRFTGDLSETVEEEISPDNPISIRRTITMPGRSVGFGVELETDSKVSIGPRVVRPEQAVLIDTTQGVAVHAPDDEIDFDMVVQGVAMSGSGVEVQSVSEFSGFELPSAAKAISYLPRTNLVRVNKRLSNRDSENVLANAIRSVSFKSSNKKVAVAVDGEVRDFTDSFTVVSVPKRGLKLISGGKTDMG